MRMKLYLFLSEKFKFKFRSFSQTVPLLHFPLALCVVMYTNNLNEKLNKGSHITRIIFFC